MGAGSGFPLLNYNVGGLGSKLKFPEFDDFINEYDLIVLTETMLDDTCDCEIPNFTLFKKNRGICKKKSGGIGVLVRDEIIKKIQCKSKRACFI